jgi:hypothetical protein
VDAHLRSALDGQGDLAPFVPGRLIGLQGRLTRPFWGVIGSWAVLCGALASNRLQWNAQDLLSLALVLLMTELGWGSLWDLSTGVEWIQLLREGWPPVGCTPSGGLPYTQPDSSSARLLRGFNRLAGWWRQAFWPVAGSAVLGCLAAATLTYVLALLLPGRLYPLHAVLVGLIVLGAIFRQRGRLWLAGQALVQVGLGWMAGQMAFTEWTVPSLVLAIAFALAVWGAFRTVQGMAGALWLVNGSEAIVASTLVWLRQPLAAGLIGLLLFGQVALQIPLYLGQRPERVVSRSWLWIVAAMLVTVLSLP